MKIKILAFIILVFAVLFVTSTTSAEDDSSSTTTTEVITSITGPADVGDPTETTVFINECIDLGDGNGIGQYEYGFLPCDLPTTTVVAVGEPPVPGCDGCATHLPSTGINSTLFIIGAVLTLAGLAMILIALRRSYSRIPKD